MASRADRERRRRARTAAASAVPESSRAAPAAVPRAGATAAASPQSGSGVRRVGRDDGLDMLLSKGRITRAQFAAGRHYAMLWRVARMEGGAPIRVMDLAGAGGGRGSGAAIAPIDESAWIADCRTQLRIAHAALVWNEAMIAVLDLICAAGMRPREISDVQREAEQIETTLRLALDQLGRVFDKALDRRRV